MTKLSAVKIIPPPPNSQAQENTTLAKSAEKVPELVPGRYIVVYKDQNDRKISEQAAQEAVQRTEAIFSELNIKQDSLIHQYKYALKGFAANLTEEQVEQLKKDPRIEAVVQDVKYKAIQIVPSANTSATALMAETTPWGVMRVGGPLNGVGKRAWVLDTGIDLDHPDLNVDFVNSVSYVPGESADDLNGHGTHVAGIIAAKDNSTGVVGVAAGADVVAVKVCNSLGQCYTSDVDAGVDYIASNYSQGDVANISLRWPVSGDPYIDLPLSVLENTIETAADDGLLFTIAAGNNKTNANNASPARVNHSNVYTISAYDDNDVFASFSNYGNPPIEYGGPGVNILSLWKNGGTYTTDGTSMAAPHVAGLLLAGPQGTGVISFDNVTNDPDGNPDAIAVADKPLSVQASGPRLLGSGQQGIFTSHVFDEEGPVSYQWYYRPTSYASWTAGGTSSIFQHTFYNPQSTTIDAAVKIEVSSAGENASSIWEIDVLPECNELTTSGNTELAIIPPPDC